jgi:hypothetical protein
MTPNLPRSRQNSDFAKTAAFLAGAATGGIVTGLDLIYQTVPVSNSGVAVAGVGLFISAALLLFALPSSMIEGKTWKVGFFTSGLSMGVLFADAFVPANHAFTPPAQENHGFYDVVARPSPSGVEIAREGNKVIAKLPAGGFRKPGLG